MPKYFGYITNQFNEPVEDAAVTDSKVFTYSDEAGNYSLDNVTGNRLQIVAAGHENKFIEVPSNSSRVDIVLNKTGVLDEVEIIAEKPKKDNSMFLLLLALIAFLIFKNK